MKVAGIRWRYVELRSTRWSDAGMKGRGKPEYPEKTSRQAISSSTIPTCENPGVNQVRALLTFSKLDFGVYLNNVLDVIVLASLCMTRGARNIPDAGQRLSKHLKASELKSR
ncbi:hypothetical protein PR048_001323 [Dryococelus australis]|uniref:Uncharacterized protein n=1 Tax=Dryococelus australis TaxID=614101 RepID=A0ABQ9IH30_9NEOP|nr:hypothetical protein PR048_001323 [Dryococelus australis]